MRQAGSVGLVRSCIAMTLFTLMENRNDEAIRISAFAKKVDYGNAHSLYNTLNTLYWNAMNAGRDELAERIHTLSQLFRHALKQKQDDITVAEEIEILSHYLYIQEVCFKRGLEYSIHVDQQIEELTIPKFLLLLLVENVVMHSILSTGSIGKIEITGSQGKLELLFTGSNNSIGIMPDEIGRMLQSDADSIRESYRIIHCAIKNVQKCLCMKYRDNFILDSQETVGSKRMISVSILLVSC